MVSKLPLSIRILLVMFIANVAFFMGYSSFFKPVNASMADLEIGEKLFKKNCSGCHLNGQNLIETTKPIIGSKEIKTKAVFKAFIENPPKPMPKFRNITDNPEQLDALYRYVISLKEK